SPPSYSLPLSVCDCSLPPPLPPHPSPPPFPYTTRFRSCAAGTQALDQNVAALSSSVKAILDSSSKKDAQGKPVSIPLQQTLHSKSEEHTSELQSHLNLVCRLLLEKKNKHQIHINTVLII